MNTPNSPTPAFPTPQPHPTTSRFAIASLVLGILGFLILPALAGLICGVVAMIQINRSAGALKGMGTAIAGTVVSGVMLAMIPVMAILAGMLLPALSHAKSKAQSIQGMNNVRQITLAMHLYADDSKSILPGTNNWCDALKPYLGGNSAVFRRPEGRDSAPGSFSSYGFNAGLAGTKIDAVNSNTVMVFEMQSVGWNTSGGPELLRRPSRGRDPVIIGFADGHAEAVASDSRLDTLRWEP